ncbi:MAG: hypothetical protein KF723_10035 [Rhizobiaceae bacterium]|nr:hypothetical protein [Rhizobiaceae bacterium]
MMMPDRADRASMPVHIRLCDGFAVTLPDLAPLDLKSRKAAALIAYLALKPGRSETRERLAGLLWGENGETQARGSLRQCLRQIRIAADAAECEILEADQDKVSLIEANVEIDMMSAYEELGHGNVSPALAEGGVVPERLLYGYEDIDPSFGSWLFVMREKWHGLFIQRLESLAVSDLSPDRRAQAAQALLALDPTHELAIRELMRHKAEAGNPASALRVFDAFREKLSNDYDLQPDKETLDLVGAVQTGMAGRQSGGGAEGARPPEQLHMKPVVFLDAVETGTAEASRHIAAGLRHMLLASLARFRHWVVIDSGYSAEAASGLSREQFAYALHVAAVDAGERIGLTVKLVEAENKRVVWSEFLFVGNDEWPTVGERIVKSLAAAFNIYLSADRLQRAQNIERGNILAFDRWMKGVFLLEKFDPDAEGEAERHFRDVIVMAPEFGPAHASLAGIYNSRHIVFPGIRRNLDREEYALRLAHKAVELEPLDARCQVTLGWSLALTKRFRQAELAFELAEELNPSDPALLMSAAHGTAICGNVKVAKERAARAMQTHPHASNFFHAILSHIHFQSGDYRQSIISAEKGGEFLVPLFGWKAAAHAFLGQKEEARDAARRLVGAARQSWRGTGPADERAIVAWFLDIFPFAAESKRERLKEGLAIAGLPVVSESQPHQRQKPSV